MAKPDPAYPGHPALRKPSYWRSVLRFGLPVSATFALANYLIRRFVFGPSPIPFPWPWRLEAANDVGLMFLAGTGWWWLMRQLYEWRKRNPPGGGGSATGGEGV
jgi:hypothetical protein